MEIMVCLSFGIIGVYLSQAIPACFKVDVPLGIAILLGVSSYIIAGYFLFP